MPRWRHLHLVVLCGLVWVAFAVRVTTLDTQSLWRDEVDALRFASTSWFEIVNTFRKPGWNGPLYFVLLRGWIALAGQTPFALRYFSLLPGVLAVPLTYILVRRLSAQDSLAIKHTTSPVGLLAAACTALSPYFVWYSQEAKMYALLLALAVLAIYALRRAIDGQARWWVMMVAATSLSVYIHILAALLIPVQFVIVLAWWPRSRRRWGEALVSFAFLTVPYLPLLHWQLPLVFTPAETGYPFYPLSEMVYILVYGFSTGLVGHLSGWMLTLPLVSLAVIGVIFGPMGWQRRLGLVAWLVLPVLTLYIVSLQRPIFTDRYLIWIGPAMYVLAALGAWVLWRQSRLLALMLVIPLLVGLGRGVYTQATQPIKSDFRAAARFVEQRAAPDDLLIFQIPYGRYTFDYYYNRSFEWAEGIYTNYGMTDAEVDAQMRVLIGAHRVVWLIATEMTMWDQGLQVFRWLEMNARRTEAAQFALVDVYRYEVP